MTRALVLNTGSSSLKWSLFEQGDEAVAGGNEPWSSNAESSRGEQIRRVLERVPAFDAVGHRVVHGGTRFRQAVVIDETVHRELVALSALDPEHMRASLAAIDAVRASAPGVTQVAAFDTAFHRSIPQAAAGYGLPFEWTERWGLYRFGFHGLSVEYAAGRVAQMLGQMPGRTIVCHLGSGCSVTALEHGRSLDTSMGFSPLEGPMMATRSGSIDPGLLLYLQEHCGVSIAELRDTLTRRSGLYGVSGVSGDLREVLEAADRGSARAELAHQRFVLGVRRALGAMVGVLGGVDALVFTGGIGENSARVREASASALAFAGLRLDHEANASPVTDRDVSLRESSVRVLVIRSREELVIKRALLGLVHA